jgi:hypothetical protein
MSVQIELREKIMNHEIANLMNDLVMLIEAQECYNETYYNSEYNRITNRIAELGGVK